MKRAAVVGAGLSGLIAANLLKSRGYDIEVYEIQSTLPDNHQAVLRFRSPALGEALGIPFKRVRAILCIAPSRNPFDNPLGASLAYSYATTGVRRTDRSITRLLDGPQVVERWVAPLDFRGILLERIKDRVMFDCCWLPTKYSDEDQPIISTVPMSSLYKMVKKNIPFDPPDFQAGEYLVISTNVAGLDAYGSMYNSNPSTHNPWTRVSITGSRVTMEVSMVWSQVGISSRTGTLFRDILEDMFNLNIDYKKSSPVIHHSKTDRILPIPDRFRKAFIMYMTDKHDVYSVGRFATWRPGMLLDEIIQDTNIVASMIEGDTAPRYEAAK